MGITKELHKANLSFFHEYFEILFRSIYAFRLQPLACDANYSGRKHSKVFGVKSHNTAFLKRRKNLKFHTLMRLWHFYCNRNDWWTSQLAASSFEMFWLSSEFWSMIKESDHGYGQYPSALTLSSPIFLPPTYSPALIYFGRKRVWWVTFNYPTVLKEKNRSKKSTTCAVCWLKSVLHEEKRREQENHNVEVHDAEKLDWKGLKIKKSVGNRKIMSDEVRHRIGKG
jgi:hypothetical protein